MASERTEQLPPLLRLPAELRDHIWYHAVCAEEGPTIEYSTAHRPIIPLFSVNRQIRHEAMSVYYKETIFVWTFENFDARAYVAWCRALPLHRTATVGFLLYFDAELISPASFKSPSGGRGQKLFLPKDKQLWPNLLFWLEHFYYRHCDGVPRNEDANAAGGKLGLINTAARLFELVGKLGKVHDMSWPQVADILDSTHRAIACANTLWAEVIDLDFVCV